MRTSMITLLAAAGIASAQTGYTTSTVRATSIITVTSCAATVTNCPAAPHVTTVIVDLYTTICPVTATETGTPIYPTSVGSSAIKSTASAPANSSVVSVVKSSPSASSPVVSVVKSTSAAVIPTTSAAGVKSTSVASITTVPVGTATSSITKASATSSSVPFNAAGANTAGGLLMAAGLVAALL